MEPLTPASPSHVRAAIARSAQVSQFAERLGSVTLLPHQQRLAARAELMLARQGGCVIADPVGTGKTHVGLALVSRFRRALIVAPAALVDQWRREMERSGITAALVSHEQLSRAGANLTCPVESFEIVLVDEAHHFRNPGTRRYRALSHLCARSRLCLLSATPVQNSEHDLRSLLALAIGDVAASLPSADLSRLVLRSGESHGIGALPRVAAAEWLPLRLDESGVLPALLSLPPPPLALHEGAAHALRTLLLVRSWSSSRAALVSTLRGRERRAVALAASLAEGRIPTRAECLAWSGGDDAVQLGFPFLAGALVAPSHDVPRASDVDAELALLGDLRAMIRARADPDVERADALRELRARHPAERILAFTESATTARRFFQLLRADAGVALLTAAGGAIASGPVSRREILDAFAPSAQGVAAPHRRAVVRLLLTTDLLSEGVNLQDASIVVHLDLPWNPARLEQRVGRVRRVGGSRVVHSYLMSPPVESARYMELVERLHTKLRSATRLLQPAFATLPFAAVHGEREGNVDVAARIAHVLRRWSQTPPPAPIAAGVSCCVRSHAGGTLAVLTDGRLLALNALGDPVEDTQLLCMLRALETDHADCNAACLTRSVVQVERVLAAESECERCGVAESRGEVRTTLRALLARQHRRLPRHRRAAFVEPVRQMAARLRQPMPIGAEQELLSLSADDPERWLVAVNAICRALPSNEAYVSGDAPGIVALAALDNATASLPSNNSATGSPCGPRNAGTGSSPLTADSRALLSPHRTQNGLNSTAQFFPSAPPPTRHLFDQTAHCCTPYCPPPST